MIQKPYPSDQEISTAAFTLTRRDDNNVEQLLSVDYPVPELLSSDAWIFSTTEFKSKQINTADFKSIFLGQMNLENVINICFRGAGYQFCNAGQIIKAIHLDVSDNNYYEECDPTDILTMASSSQSATVNAFIFKSILPLPKYSSNFQTLDLTKYTVDHSKVRSQYIYCDLPTDFSNALWASLLSLISTSKKYDKVVYLAFQNKLSCEIESLMGQLLLLFPNIVLIHADSTKREKQKRAESLIAVSHPGVINKEIMN